MIKVINNFYLRIILVLTTKYFLFIIETFKPCIGTYNKLTHILEI